MVRQVKSWEHAHRSAPFRAASRPAMHPRRFRCWRVTTLVPTFAMAFALAIAFAFPLALSFGEALCKRVDPFKFVRLTTVWFKYAGTVAAAV